MSLMIFKCYALHPKQTRKSMVPSAKMHAHLGGIVNVIALWFGSAAILNGNPSRIPTPAAEQRKEEYQARNQETRRNNTTVK